MVRVITFTSFTQGINPMRQPHPQDTDSVLQPGGFHVDILSPLSQESICLSLLWWIRWVLWWDPSEDGRDGTRLRMKVMTMSSGNVMKWNKIRLRGMRRKSYCWLTCSWSKHNSSWEGPPRGAPVGRPHRPIRHWRGGILYKAQLSQQRAPHLKIGWMHLYGRQEKAETKVDDMKNDSEGKHILWSSINCAFNPDSWTASIAEGSIQPRFSFLTPKPLRSPAFSKKAKEYENQINSSKTGQQITKMKIMKIIFQNRQGRLFPFNSRFYDDYRGTTQGLSIPQKTTKKQNKISRLAAFLHSIKTPLPTFTNSIMTGR